MKSTSTWIEIRVSSGRATTSMTSPGRGYTVVRAKNGVQVAVINLQGRSHMQPIDCPFRKADQILEEIDPSVKVRFVDFHAELTSEKMAMGWHLNGRVSAVIGTHTHVPTADTRILSGGTAYQTDVGHDRALQLRHRSRQRHHSQAFHDLGRLENGGGPGWCRITLRHRGCRRNDR